MTCIPNKKINIDDELDNLYDGNIRQIDSIKKTIGLNSRYIANDNETTADLCETAAKELLKQININKVMVIKQLFYYSVAVFSKYMA